MSQTLPVKAQSGAAGLPVDALVLVDADNMAAMDETIDFIEARGGQVFVTFAPHAMLVKFPPEDVEGWIGQMGIDSITTDLVNVAQIEQTYGDQAGLAARGWNNWLNTAGDTPADPQLPLGSTMVNDVLMAPDLPPGGELEAAAAPLDNYTSEFLYGRVQVDIFLPESILLTTDLPSENWLPTQEDAVVSEITAGLVWWAATALQGGRPSANLSFNLTFHTPSNEPAVVKTNYEPITRPRTDQGLWIGQIMSNLGYSGSYFTAVRQYVHSQRVATGRDWGFAIFVVNSLLDLDGYFSDNYFAYAYIYGPFIVMTYDNDSWGIDRMEIVTAHEAGHIFGALDEYTTSGCSDTAKSGYLAVANSNCENGDPATEHSIMRSSSSQQIAYPANLASTPVRGQVGWRDGDNDGLYDVVDTNVSLQSLSASTDGPTAQYTGLAADEPYDSPSRPNASINTISLVEYRLNGGSWLSALANDGSFNGAIENYSLTTAPLNAGTYSIQIRARNSVGNYSAIFNNTFDILPASLTTPTEILASSGLYTTRVHLTWTAVAGATKYEICRSTSNSFDSASCIATVNGLSYDDTSAVSERTYYYWVISYGSAGYSISAPVTGKKEMAVPTNVSINDSGYTDRVRVTWSPVSGASAYAVYRSATFLGSKLLLDTTNHNYYDDFTAVEGVTYYYFVTAGNSYGSSDYSAPIIASMAPLNRVYLPLVIK